jgi:GMP reductase
MKIDYTPQFGFKDVLIRPKGSITTESQVCLEREFVFPNTKTTWHGVPIFASMGTGTFEGYDVLSEFKMVTCFNKFYTISDFENRILEKEINPEYFMISTGIQESEFANLYDIIKLTNAKWICVDVDNGYMKNVVTYCSKLRESFPDKIIVAGNVSTKDMVEELIINGGVDVVKIGSDTCLTRKTGVGVPQLSAIIDCADGAHGCDGYIIGSDGITCPGDMAKAFGGGADFVMMGQIENPGEINKLSPEHARNKHSKMENYKSPEGKIPYRGKLEDTVRDYLGGLRSMCAYINANNIKYIPKFTTFLMAP